MSDNTALTELSQQLAVSFRNLLTECAIHGQTSQESDQERLLAEFGRFRIWTEQTGAALRGKDSLDDTLQKDAQLRSSIIETFQQIKELLRVAMEMSSCSTSGTSALDLSEELLTSDSDYSEHTGISNEEVARSRPKVTRLSLAMSHIHEQIGLLYHHSAMLRRPRIGGRYLHSRSNKDQSDIPYWELSHVRQKLEQWNLSATQDSRTGMNVTTSDKPLKLPSLKYWSQHPWMLEEQPKEGLMPDDDTLSSPEPSETPSGDTIPTALTFSSVAESAGLESNPEARPGRTVFECPYCHTALESSQMLKRNTWKRHVFRDLRPYTCTFSGCTNPERLYATRRDWVYHEMQMHRRVWSCRLCTYTSTIKQDLVDHLLEFHRGDCQRNQITLLLEAGNGSMEESTSQECCFCHQLMSLRRLMDHMAAHLEDLALFVLHVSNNDVLDDEEYAALASLDSESEDISQNSESILPFPDIATQESTALLPKIESFTKTDQSMIESSKNTSLTPETLFTCDKCNTTFDTLHNFLNHKGCRRQPYECPFPKCNKIFIRARDLKKHSNLHIRPHECPYPECNKRCAERRDLDRHKSLHHGEPGRGFHCPEPDCRYFEGGQSFTRKDNLKRHMGQMHHNA
ncbi:C2H2 type zinc finger domain protein [Apiospora arundinis]|uniref:C2H2 type zinc finger domain protein n=1 Tax=Apiospora arundinis TaxID=335852 RepID=A0ABR2I0N4_9PEZI